MGGEGGGGCGRGKSQKDRIFLSENTAMVHELHNQPSLSFQVIYTNHIKAMGLCGVVVKSLFY